MAQLPGVGIGLSVVDLVGGALAGDLVGVKSSSLARGGSCSTGSSRY